VLKVVKALSIGHVNMSSDFTFLVEFDRMQCGHDDILF
jgi:hypothetical protein